MKIYGTNADDRKIFELLHGQMQDRYFPVQFSDLGSHIQPDHLDDGKRNINGVIVDYFNTHHPGGSLAYSISYNGHKVVYSTDNELDQILLNRDATLADTSIQGAHHLPY